ncbi:MAG: hypothetical protein ACC652_08635, partial [Acidimicrobiales bacterium]
EEPVAAPVVGPATTQPQPHSVDEAPLAGLSDLLKRVESGAGGTEVTFGDLLRKQIANGEIRPEDLAAARRGSEEMVIDLRDDSGPSLAEREAAAIEARRRRAARRQRQARLRADSGEVKQPAVQQPSAQPPVASSESSVPVADRELGAPEAPSWSPPARAAKALETSDSSRLGRPTGSAVRAGSVDWSLDRLAAIGLPFSFVQDLVGIDNEDDLGWIRAIAHRFEQYCRPLPLRESVYVGPRAAQLATVLGIPSVTFPDNPPYGGSVCLRMDDDGAHRAWLTRVRGDRAMQLVIGGTGWIDLLSKDPVAVSYVGGPELLIPAMQLCIKRDIALGYSVTASGGLRLNPLDAALQIRTLLGRR